MIFSNRLACKLKITKNLNIGIFVMIVGIYPSFLVPANSDPSFITVSKSTFTNNRAVAIGMWGCPNVLVEDNQLDNNGFIRPMLDHPIYISGSDKGRVTSNVVIRNNRLTNNAMTSGLCQATAIVGHDVAADWVIEGNVIYQAPGSSYPTCWGISMSPGNGGYTEGMDRLVIRGNTIVNVGNRGIEVAACRDCTIENNVTVWQSVTEAIGIEFHAPKTSPTYTGTAVKIRNNSSFFFRTNDTSRGLVVNDPGVNHQVVSNLIYFGPESIAAVCFDSNLPSSAFAVWDNNLCYGANAWTRDSLTKEAFAASTGFDSHSLNANPSLVAAPSLSNNFSMALSGLSPAINAGHLTKSAPSDFFLRPRMQPDIGAYEFAGGEALERSAWKKEYNRKNVLDKSVSCETPWIVSFVRWEIFTRRNNNDARFAVY